MFIILFFAACTHEQGDSAGRDTVDSDTGRPDTVEVNVNMYDPTPDCWSRAMYVGDSDYWWDVVWGDYSADIGSLIPFVDGRCAFHISDQAYQQVRDDPAVCPTQECMDYCFLMQDTRPDCGG